MDPADFLNVSSRLWTSAAEEDRRTSISRSYYALYLVLYLDLSTQGVQFRNGGKDHRWLSRSLMNCSDANAYKVGQELANRHADRITADYQMNTVIELARSEFAYKSARAMLEFYRALNAADLNALVQAIKTVPPPAP